MNSTTPNTTQTLRAMANERRLAVLFLLAEGEQSVTQLNHRVPLSQSALSQHLKILRDAEVVSTRRDSQAIFYSLSPEGEKAVEAALLLSQEAS